MQTTAAIASATAGLPMNVSTRKKSAPTVAPLARKPPGEADVPAGEWVVRQIVLGDVCERDRRQAGRRQRERQPPLFRGTATPAAMAEVVPAAMRLVDHRPFVSRTPEFHAHSGYLASAHTA